ncbi:MAG: ABC transporter permease [Acidobacteriaceae bacterium]
MQFLSRLKSLAHNLLHKPAIESELDQELQSYAETITEEKIVAGMSPAEARRTTLAELGGLEQVKQSVRDRRTGTGFELLWQDVRYVFRQLARNRAFTLTAVLTLALGIGATTAIFSAVYALLIRPLPYPDANRLLYVSAQTSNAHNAALGSQDFVAGQTSTKSFEHFAGYYDYYNQNLTGPAGPLRIASANVTANFLPMLGVFPQLGRLFADDEDRPAGPPVAVISNHLWRTYFHADPAIVGKSIVIDGKSLTVIGVLPARFNFPDLTLEPDVYATADLDRDTTLAIDKPIIGIRTIVRLRPGVSIENAQAELQAFYLARLQKVPAEFRPFVAGREITLQPLQRYLSGDSRKPLFILLACVAAVLLIACVNVANLQLARAVSRRHETALRGALGASRLRLIRQSLVESLVLSSLAAVLGLAIAVVITAFVRSTGTLATSPSSSRISQLLQLPFGKLSASIYVDGWVLAFTICLALLTTLLFGLAPAISGTRLDLRNALQSAAMHVTQAREQRLLRHGLLVVEIALAMVLLASAGLLVRSFVNVMRYDSGFDSSATITGTTLLAGPRYDRPDEHGNPSPSPDLIRIFINNLLPRLQALPGVQSAAMTSALPLGRVHDTAITFGSPTPPPAAATWKTAPSISITPDYFHVVGTTIVQGRAFNSSDTATSLPVAIVNRAFARHYFAGNALGERFNYIVGRDQFAPITIVGIAQDVRHNGLEQPIRPEFYVPETQAPSDGIYIALRSTADPTLLANAMRKAVLAVDPQQPVFDIQTMDQRVSALVARRRLIMLLITCFALLAVILSAVGVYGVFAYSVSQRTQEMGIRLALGASPRKLLGLIVAQAARLIAVGGVLGLGGAFLLSRFLTSMLVGVKPHDALSFALAWMLMTAIALLASTIPASHAARTNLVSVLRAE